MGYKSHDTLVAPSKCNFNLPLSKRIFLDKWNISSIIPISKSGSRSNIENKRELAMLPTIGKLFEPKSHVNEPTE